MPPNASAHIDTCESDAVVHESAVGRAVGIDVGSPVGSIVGVAVGVLVGAVVGPAVGPAVGMVVGMAVGKAVGSGDGTFTQQPHEPPPHASGSNCPPTATHDAFDE